MNREKYLCPTVERRTIMMEGCMMAQSGEPINSIGENTVQLNISNQNGADGFNVSGEWTDGF